MTPLIRLAKDPCGIAGLVLVLCWSIIALLAPVLAPPSGVGDPYEIPHIGFSPIPQAPSSECPFGTSGRGYDIYYGIIWGSRTAFRVGLVVVLCAGSIGVLLGGLGAFVGGWLDEVVMRITDLFMSLPFMIAVIVMSIVLGKGLDKVIFALVFFGWRRYARVMRSEVLAIKEKDFVSAARSLGSGVFYMFFRHILPNAVFPVFVLATLDIGRMVLITAALSFIGVGAEPGYADWGQMINFSRQWILGAVGRPFFFWYTYTYPSIAISTFVLGWTLLGDTLRDVLDPKMRNVR